MDESKSRLIYISSDNRIQNGGASTTTNYTIDLGASSMLHKVSRVTLKSCSFVNAAYNVRAGVNDIIKWNHNAIDYQATIQAGFYNTTVLRGVLKTEMDLAMAGAGVTVTITQNPITGKLEFAWSVAGGFIYDFAGGSTISPEIGFITLQVGSNPSVADKQPSLEGLTHAFLHSSVLAPANMVYSNQDLKSTVVDVPVTVPYGFTNHYEPYDSETASRNYDTPTDIRLITISFEGGDGSPLDINGFETELVFKVYFA